MFHRGDTGKAHGLLRCSVRLIGVLGLAIAAVATGLAAQPSNDCKYAQQRLALLQQSLAGLRSFAYDNNNNLSLIQCPPSIAHSQNLLQDMYHNCMMQYPGAMGAYFNNSNRSIYLVVPRSEVDSVAMATGASPATMARYHAFVDSVRNDLRISDEFLILESNISKQRDDVRIKCGGTVGPVGPDCGPNNQTLGLLCQ